MHIEANRAYVVLVTAATTAALIVGVLAVSRFDGVFAFLAFLLFVIFGLRFLYLVGPARLITRSWIAADRNGIAARSAHGITRYGWDRVVSVRWQFAGRGLGRYTIVEVTPTLGEPESPYGPINPYEVYLWFLGRKRRSLEIGRQFLSVCRKHGATTSLLVGRVREP